MQKNLVDFFKTGQRVHESTDGAAFLSPDNGGTEGGAKTIEAKELAHFAESRQVSNEVQRVYRSTGQQVKKDDAEGEGCLPGGQCPNPGNVTGKRKNR